VPHAHLGRWTFVTSISHTPAALVPDLPRRALLVAPTPEEAAVLGLAFDEIRAATVEELEAVLAAEGAQVPCVAVTGVPTRGGRLASIVDQVLGRCSTSVQVLLDHSEPWGTDLVAHGSEALRGLSLVDLVDLGGVPCLRLRPGPDRGLAPDLAPLRENLIGRPGAQERITAAVEALGAPGQAERLQTRIAELEAELAEATNSSATAAAALAKARTEHKSVVATVNRLQETPGVRAALVVDRIRRAGLRELRRSPRVRKAVKKAALATAALGLVAADLVVVALITETGPGGAVVTVLVLVSLAELAYALRTDRRLTLINRQVAAGDRGGVGQGRADTATATQRLTEVERVLTDLSAITSDLGRNLAIVTAASVDTARSVATLPEAILSRIPSANGRASLPDLWQTQAVANLFSMLPVDDVVPAMGGAEVSPDAILLLVQELRARRPGCVLVCGGGAAVVWLALAARRYDLDTRIVALEHDPTPPAPTREWLARHGVAGLVDVREAPLEPTGLPNHQTAWYATRAISDLDGVGLVFVDGPPETVGPRVRLPAVPLLLDRLAPNATIVLDDLGRHDEPAVADAWSAQLPGFAQERPPLEKGAAIFRRG
jgi:predicted O-methyltransferase YrrM